MKNKQLVILVDDHDQPIGSAEKLYAHQHGLLHRAFSIFIFRQHQGEIELLLQQRAATKYHSAGLWTNTCCSHPQPNQATELAAYLRLAEETGIITTQLQPAGQFQYHAPLDNHLIEHEKVHVFIGKISDKSFTPNPAEIAATKWLSLNEIEQRLQTHPEQFTAWFADALNLVKKEGGYKKLFNINEKKSEKRFSQHTRHERLYYLWQQKKLTTTEINELARQDETTVNILESFIENTVGYFELPLGIVPNVIIDGQAKILPLAVEETSIIAALTKTAKWVNHCGTLTTKTLGNNILGQIQVNRLKNPENFQKAILEQKENLINEINRVVLTNLVRRGGGANDLTVRLLKREDDGYMGVIHLHIDPIDAMGANMVNLACEALKFHIAQITAEEINLCIVSNLVDNKLVRAQIILKDINPQLAMAISEASHFAKIDPYRAATHNKGVMNAIDAILIATGNDWRAVEAGIHAYAARDGQYRAITEWAFKNNKLYGEILIPLNVATVGGVTRIHPTAKSCLKLLDIKHAHELARIIAAAGLLQNLGAIRALVTEGISQGHMKLHLKNLFIQAGASADEQKKLQPILLEQLKAEKKLSISHIQALLMDIRNEHIIHSN